MSDPKTESTDALLREFLVREAIAARKGITIESLHVAVKRIADDRNTDRLDLARYMRRTRAIERQVETVSEREDVPDWRPDPAEITGTHELALIKAQHEEMRDDAKWRKRISWQLVGGFAFALILSAITGCVTYAVTHIQSASATLAK